MAFNFHEVWSVKKISKKMLLTLPKFLEKFPIRSGVIKKSCRCYKFENNNVFEP